MQNIISELKDDVNQLNNNEFVNICLLFYKHLQVVNDKILNKMLNHDANKIIIYKLYKLSKLNGNYIIYKMYFITRV